MRQCERFDLAAVFERDDDTGLGRLDARGARLREHVHALSLEDLFDDLGRICVFVRQHALARGDERDLGSDVRVRVGELGARHTRADHDEVLGHVVHRVELGPGQDALAVGHRARQLTGAGADGDDDGVCFELVEVSALLARRDDDAAGADEAALALHDRDACALELCLHVERLLAGEREQASVDRLQVHCDLWLVGSAGLAAHVELHAEGVRIADRRRALGRRDQRLRRHDIGQHGRASDADALNERDVSTELCSGESCLSTSRTAADDNYLLGACCCIHTPHLAVA